MYQFIILPIFFFPRQVFVGGRCHFSFRSRGGLLVKKFHVIWTGGYLKKCLLTHSAASIVVVVVFNWMGLNKMIQVRCIFL